MNKKNIRNTEIFVRAVEQENSIKAKDFLEKVLKEKCAQKIANVLKNIK